MTLEFNVEAGKRYEDTYGGWLTFFKTMAEQPRTVACVPPSWYPFVKYLGGDAHSVVTVFKEDKFVHPNIVKFVDEVVTKMGKPHLRTLVEMYATLRPELVDALYKADVEWETQVSVDQSLHQHPFLVTNNNAFFRREVISFMTHLHEYVPPPHIRRAILVPCAADKPYPSLLHQKVMSLVPEDAHLIVATGVLGLVPQEEWDKMPNYDSGLPNQWRLMKEVEWYFHRWRKQYDLIVVYCDFYNEAIMRALEKVEVHALCVNRYTAYYLDLMDSERLSKLQKLSHLIINRADT